MQSEEDRKVRDTISDPAHTPGDGWAEEGGASHYGPATHTKDGTLDAEAERERAEVAEENFGEVDEAERGSAS
ncbi:hypothetical protein JD292_08405 [Leucobacter sp. CSA2]|uniref:Uncharacterized protein n=1 Tax=Leucobacter edaphi TaxID=2796472 RepID=A0A934QE30_9MICO|nr:hypothetical protein [Leucobacter edaphi]MBK0422095.1 hypothetical protein [Leucobacter edaphi]